MNRRRATSQGWLILGGRVICASAILFGLTFVVYRLVNQPESRKLNEMQAELSRVRSEIAWRTEDVASRRLLVEALKSDPQTIEDFARDELFMVYPHEITLRLTERPVSP